MRDRGHPPLYNPAWEHDGCGAGFIADLGGVATHELVRLGIRALVNLTHRGAVSADAASGDGAGVTIQLPRELLASDAAAFGLRREQFDRLAVAMVFLPVAEPARSLACKMLCNAVRESGIAALGWRAVPIDRSVLGGVALASLPGIEQLLLARPAEMSEVDFERALYLARKRAESAFRSAKLDAYVASMSARTIVYKGLMVAPQLEAFYPDLSDERTRSAIVLFHQRFATNTLPEWYLAQPFRMIAHNGEINTVLGNRNWMRAREPELISDVWGDAISDLLPVVRPTGSDTASLDEALELLVLSGKDPLSAMATLIPEAWENMRGMDEGLRAFYQYHACLTEPWDGPAAVAFTDGAFAAAAMDRNGLRPVRYQVTRDGMVLASSEVGVLELPARDVVESGRIGPGQMIAVDTLNGRLLRDADLKRRIARRRPYGRWVRRHLCRHPRLFADRLDGGGPAIAELSRMHVLHGYTHEEISLVLEPMARHGREPVGSMGDDTPLSVLNDADRPLYTYFRQRFAQVTNPPIDSIRERIVMSLDTYLGRKRSLLEERPEAARLVHLASPILTSEELRELRRTRPGGLDIATLVACFRASQGVTGLEATLDELCRTAVAAIDAGHDVLVVSDRTDDAEQAPVPMVLAISAVHHHLIRSGRRMRASLVAEAADARDVHHAAALIGFGASAVNPYLALDTVAGSARAGRLGERTPAQAIDTYVRGLEVGLLKVMSKMGISTVSSYHGAQIFEALGLGEELILRYFPGTTSRIGGIGLADIAADILTRHTRAIDGAEPRPGGWYKYRRRGDYHAHEPPVWRALHAVVQGGGRDAYRAYSKLVHSRPPTALRDLLDFRSDREPIDIAGVESVQTIVKRFQTGAMSLGALSAEAHEDIARALNRLGGLANTGEGGEDPRRYLPDGDRREAGASVKQVASGRFGVTAAYLAGAQELEIKIAQGSKPGEGGQLPGGKVSEYIAKLRHVNPGTTLISPPPHHDIYSIEDIAQLIYDLKMVNPDARVCVKLVAAEGVGTIAAGVAKAYADVIQISGADGGTGASPLSSIKYAGDPWELGLAETQQTLVMNGLRSRVTLSTDGGFHTGRDVVMAALLGAERYGFGTAALIAMGCKMARQCHMNTCPVGIATQREELRKKYFGTPEMLTRFLTHVAYEVRETLAALGYGRLEDVIGRADLLVQALSKESSRWRGVELSKVTALPLGGRLRGFEARNDRPPVIELDDRIIAELRDAIELDGSFAGRYPIRNTDRAVGGRVSGVIARRYGDSGLPKGSIELTFEGSAGQSFGAWLVHGVRLGLVGGANDYVGKGMSGGEIWIRPPGDAGYRAHEATLVGNTVLYGATGGALFIAGRGGERFAVRNSGATAVVEGVGKHGCEYMTGGVVVILGATGRNFGAGMSGGTAYVLDEGGDLPWRVNPALVEHMPLTDAHDIERLRALVQRQLDATGSARAAAIIGEWDRYLPMFWRIEPRLAASSASSTTRTSPPRRAPVQPSASLSPPTTPPVP